MNLPFSIILQHDTDAESSRQLAITFIVITSFAATAEDETLKKGAN